MKLLLILSAFVAGAALYMRRHSEEKPVQEDDGAKWSEDDPQEEDSCNEMQQEELGASVRESSRAMDPLTLQGASRVTFDCADGKKRKFIIPGQNGAFLTKGDRGLLTFAGSAFISFEKEDGEFISPLFHTAPERRKA